MRLPHHPRPWVELQAAYPAALDPPCDAESIAIGVQEAATSQARCCFDFEDGMRLVVSRDVQQSGKRILHLSMSFADQTELYHKLRTRLRHRLRCGDRDAPVHVTRLVCRLAILRFRKLSGDYRPLEFLCFSEEKMVPHWMVKE